uniref:Nodulation protein E n=1 Tax=Eucampia antarctica TaxID=49252 RepID=A0A7S2R3K1_9STRA|mmetsp:Transcript_16113/g.15542  ORF Transcript_16113/g.15542 Transcript_16113/m.15542 type:complete len:480 (+) Transcript_16113:60-1499(+)|eukprot:CAMPEP_0197827766 /NCGR_PEP_ID=MMETSP1437-20131217/4481_1 /TAXON_ID=49252 ORGANISM="Eucampia antarctica, Strain CCMP1452" /NCGR_SAMPLE_ID=MMETSP1437 /ASSEMBLY_ACC=CAM_ASM_001096 /LENGTH=479 /DNA_ID=CAMNT_0043428749 /DNA_START=47 /DNA_END=1486 /DNA_ORIENTATION=+
MKFPVATSAIFVFAVSSVSAFAPSNVGSAFVGNVRIQGREATLSAVKNDSSPRQNTCLYMATDRRVVVTGMGITSCLGNTLEDVTTSLKEGKSGITFNQEWSDLGIKSQVCGIPDLTEADFKELIPKASLRFMGTNAKYAYVAMQRAIEDSKLTPEEYENNPRIAAILGQGGTSIPDIVETVDAVKNGGRWKNKVGPFRVTRSMGSTTSAVLSTAFKLQGPSFSISSACSTGAHCIGTGFEQIILGKSEMAFCGAGENVQWQFTSMFDCMGALTTKRNDDPTKASRAFDQDRDGFCIAGGGGVVILEELEHAKARGARIYAELTGYGANSDGYDMVAPSGVGGQNCMKIAMDEADSRGGKKNVDYVNTHGTSTPVGDVMELSAIKNRFDEAGYQPNVGSTKSLSGHALGAAGVHESIYSILMMNNDFMAESINIENLVDEAKGMNILTSRKDGEFKRAMSNSFGFGGTNCALVFDKYEE